MYFFPSLFPLSLFFVFLSLFFVIFLFLKKNFWVPFQRLQTTGNRPRVEKDGRYSRTKRIVSLLTYLFFHVVFFGIRGEKIQYLQSIRGSSRKYVQFEFVLKILNSFRAGMGPCDDCKQCAIAKEWGTKACFYHLPVFKYQ